MQSTSNCRLWFVIDACMPSFSMGRQVEKPRSITWIHIHVGPVSYVRRGRWTVVYCECTVVYFLMGYHPFHFRRFSQFLWHTHTHILNICIAPFFEITQSALLHIYNYTYISHYPTCTVSKFEWCEHVINHTWINWDYHINKLTLKFIIYKKNILISCFMLSQL